MDPHRAGPSIQTVLTRQTVHCSSLLWDAFLEGEEVPGVLACRHREKGLFECGLDPQIATYITDAGLDGLLQVPHMDLDHALITALVERWRPETHSFHLPHGEMTITLQDIEVIMGVPVHGLPVVGFTYMDKWRDFCMELLGHYRLSGNHIEIIWVPCPHIVQQAKTYGGPSFRLYIFGWLKAITPNVFSDSLG
ncbi:serine/threonine-protein phosphatase 7 long form homolog [Castanea sativa]|uniref:serine/threonine-protein phosphatase 7 long form homolog n=1 Tax=Castanea sativa TaxID=21020 RepID=UPI003F651B39